MQYTVVGAEATTTVPNARPDLVLSLTDRLVTVGTISDSESHGFCAAANSQDLRDDIRFNTATARAVNATERILLWESLSRPGQHPEWLT